MKKRKNSKKNNSINVIPLISMAEIGAEVFRIHVLLIVNDEQIFKSFPLSSC